MAPGQCMGCLDGEEYPGAAVHHTCGLSNKPETDGRWSVVNKLRGTTPKSRTSTYDKDSLRAVFGSEAERRIGAWLERSFSAAGKDWVVRSFDEIKASRFRIFNDWDWRNASLNSRHGDLYVYEGPNFLFSIEVKCSLDYPNVSITREELAESTTSYLLGVTTEGPWLCTVLEACRTCVSVGRCYIVPYDETRKLTIKELIDVEERNQAAGPDPIPF